MAEKCVRTCMGCNEKKQKNEMLRIVKYKNGTISIDKTGKIQARGAYICKDINCIEKLKKNKRILKAFKIKTFPEEVYKELEKYIKENNIDK